MKTVKAFFENEYQIIGINNDDIVVCDECRKCLNPCELGQRMVLSTKE